MKRFFVMSFFLALLAMAQPAEAQVSDADARLMENMAADEDGWSGGDDAAEDPATDEDPDFHEEQNPQEGMRRMPAPAPDKTAPRQQP